MSTLSIRLNGEVHEVPTGTSITVLLELAGYGQRRVAVESNGDIVPRSQHATTLLQAGDRLEVVHAIGGG